MKNIIFTFILFCTSFLMAQKSIVSKEKVTPPQKVRDAFERGYPNKLAVWSLEYGGDDNDEIRYQAKFDVSNYSKGLAVYDNLGYLKAYELQIPLSQLPAKAQTYLKNNYPAKAVHEIAVVVNDKNKTTYEVGVEKKGVFYDVVFDKNGGFDVIVQKD
ncbi:hypothetical protein AR687_17150 [Flavobacteriaceae bacterium CRH]|nr:hypothetical protein AR687_17150 [Flavobacteriaceae bacterium CRH]